MRRVSSIVQLAAGLVLGISLGGFGVAAQAATHVVPDDHPSITTAIAAAVDGDEIVVRPGLYNESLDFLGKSIVVRSLEGPEATVIDATGYGGAAVFRSSEDSLTRLEGFTLTGGIGTLVIGTRYGGAILVSDSSPTIVGNIIRGNRADLGGGVCCWPSAFPTFEGNVIRENVAAQSGGGVFVSGGSAPWFRDNHIESNRAFGGGGFFVTGTSSPLLEGNVIQDNLAASTGGALMFQASSGIVKGNDIRFNRATWVLSLGGGIYCRDAEAVTIEGNNFEGNFAPRGGGVAVIGGTARIAGNRFHRNGGNDGGGMRTEETTVEIHGNRFSENFATLGGGASIRAQTRGSIASNLFVANRSADGGALQGGGAVYLSSVLDFVGNTLVGNRSVHTGGAVHARVNAVIKNCILWDNLPYSIGTTEDLPTVRHSIVQGGWNGPGANVLDEAPWFVDPAAFDFRLQHGSPGIDAASNSAMIAELDADGEPRLADGDQDSVSLVDMGAFEARPELMGRFGTVGAADGPVVPVLRVNGEAGDLHRITRLSLGDPLVITLDAPPAGPSPARFALYAWLAEPDDSTVSVQPFGLGLAAFPTPLSPPSSDNQPQQIWNNLGAVHRLGIPGRPSEPAPSTVLAIDRAPFPVEITLQGIIEDAASRAELPASLTNAIVLRVSG